MNDEQVRREIDEIERALVTEDAAFVHRIRNLRRNEAVHAVAVFGLLAVGAVLLTIGMATYALIPWSLGAVAFALAVLVDELHQRTQR